MMSADNHNDYVDQYIQTALSSEVLHAPDVKRAGSQIDLLQALFEKHQNGGIITAKDFWTSFRGGYLMTSDNNNNSDAVSTKKEDVSRLLERNSENSEMLLKVVKKDIAATKEVGDIGEDSIMTLNRQSVEAQYVQNYIVMAMRAEKLDAPDPQQANGSHNFLLSIHAAHRYGGSNAVAAYFAIQHTPKTSETTEASELTHEIISGKHLLDEADYIHTYIVKALRREKLEAPDVAQAGEKLDLLQALFEKHQVGGCKSAKAYWEAVCKQNPQYEHLVESSEVEEEYGRHFDNSKGMYDLRNSKYLYEQEIMINRLHILYGASGIGKSFVALDYALNVSQDYRVLYAAGEGYNGYADRLKAWLLFHEGCYEDNIFFTRKPPLLMNTVDVDYFIAAVSKFKPRPALIIIDTLSYALVGGDENSARDMQFAMTNCTRIMEALNCSLLLVHHATKSNVYERGSSVLRGTADVMLKLDLVDDVMVLSCEKNKEDEAFPTRYLRRLRVPAREGNTSCVVIPADKVVSVTGEKLTNTQREVLEFLGMEIFRENGVYSRQIKQELPDVRAIYNVLNNLVGRGYLYQTEKGDPFKITDKGLRAIGKSGKTDTSDKEQEHPKENGKSHA